TSALTRLERRHAGVSAPAQPVYTMPRGYTYMSLRRLLAVSVLVTVLQGSAMATAATAVAGPAPSTIVVAKDFMFAPASLTVANMKSFATTMERLHVRDRQRGGREHE